MKVGKGRMGKGVVGGESWRSGEGRGKTCSPITCAFAVTVVLQDTSARFMYGLFETTVCYFSYHLKTHFVFTPPFM